MLSPTLSVNEVASTVKSVANGTWEYRNEIGTYRKHILGLPAIAEDLNEDEKNAECKKRMSIGASQTHRMRKSATELAILNALETLGLPLGGLRLRERKDCGFS